jgi:hypothetical protein
LALSRNALVIAAMMLSGACGGPIDADLMAPMGESPDAGQVDAGTVPVDAGAQDTSPSPVNVLMVYNYVAQQADCSHVAISGLCEVTASVIAAEIPWIRRTFAPICQVIDSDRPGIYLEVWCSGQCGTVEVACGAQELWCPEFPGTTPNGCGFHWP